MGEPGQRNVVKPDQTDIARDRQPRLFKRAHRADRDQVAGGKHRVKRLALGQQHARRAIAGRIGCHRAEHQIGIGGDACLNHGIAGAAPAVMHFGRVARCLTQKGNPAIAARNQVARRQRPAQPIVAPDRHARRIGGDRAPAHIPRALVFQLVEPFAIGFVIAIPQQHDAVGLAAIFVIDVHAARKLLE